MYVRPLTNVCSAMLKDDGDNDEKNEENDEELANERREPALRPLEDLARPRVRAKETNPLPFVHPTRQLSPLIPAADTRGSFDCRC